MSQRISLLFLCLVLLCSPLLAERIFEQNGNTMVPLKYIAEWLGATMTVNPKTKGIAVTYGGKTVTGKVNSKAIVVAGKTVQLPGAILEGKGVVYIPARFVTDAFGVKVARGSQDEYWIPPVIVTHPKTGKQLILPLNEEPDEYTTPLHLDAYNGLTELAGRHLAAGAKLTVTDSTGKTPLDIAIIKGNMEMVKYLVGKGAPLNDPTEYGNLPLNTALTSKQGEIAQFLLDKGAVGNTSSLALAAGRGVKGIVEHLLAKGVPVNPEDDFGGIPLIEAAENGHLEIVDLLLAKGADLNAKSWNGQNALFAAAEEGRKAIVARLIEKGAKVNVVATKWHTSCSSSNGYADFNYELEGFTPLQIATREGHLGVATTLVNNGADTAAKTDDGLTALHCAMLAFEGDDSADMIELLVAKGCNVNEKTGLFTMKLSYGGAEGIKVRDLTPLHLAALSNQDTKVRVKALLAAAADVNAKTNNGMTPLHLAALNGEPERVCTMLIDKGADVNAKTNDGLTPLKLATMVKNLKAIDVLKEHGGKE